MKQESTNKKTTIKDNSEVLKINADILLYLCNKGFEASDAIDLLIFLFKNKIENPKVKFENVYKMFSFVGLTNNEVNILILKENKILLLSLHELMTLTYVWNQTKILNKKTLLTIKKLKLLDYMRVYLRNEYLKLGKDFFDSQITYYALTIGDEKFSEDYKVYSRGNLFKPSYSSLVNYFGKGNTFEKREYFIKKTISSKSLAWYLDHLKKETEKKNGRSI